MGSRRPTPATGVTALSAWLCLTAMLAALCSLTLTACGSTNSTTTRQRSSGPSVAAVAAGSVRHVPPFPRVSPGAHCPRTPGGHATRTTGITLGPGPVYPVMGFAVAPPARGGVIDYQQDGKPQPNGLWANKVLFAVSPRYGDAFTVQGNQIDCPNPVAWLIENGQVVRKLELPGRLGWHYYATSALL